MKFRFIKVLLPVLALAMVLSGCNLIEVDETKVIRKEMEKIDKEYSAVVSEYDGGEVTVGEMMNDFNYAYSENYYMMVSYFGMELTESDIRDIAESTMVNFTEGEIIAMHYDREFALSEEELAEIEEIVNDEYRYNLEDALGSVDGKNDAEKQAYAELLLKQNGMDKESMRISYTNYYKRENMREILRGEITDVADEDVRAAYEEAVEANKADYANGMAFENDMCDENAVICWKPEGYRTVKHILVMPSDEVKGAYQDALYALEDKEIELGELYSEMQLDSTEKTRTPDEIQADIAACEAAVEECIAAVEAAEKACLDDVKAVTDEIYTRLESGEDFEKLIAEYGEDPGMQGGITAENGYCVAENSVNWEPNFRDGAMALENVGDYTLNPVVSGSGVHIIRYEADVVPGEAGIENVYDALREEALANLQENHADEVIARWVDEADPAYDLEVFMKVLYG